MLSAILLVVLFALHTFSVALIVFWWNSNERRSWMFYTFLALVVVEIVLGVTILVI